MRINESNEYLPAILLWEGPVAIERRDMRASKHKQWIWVHGLQKYPYIQYTGKSNSTLERIGIACENV